MKLTCQQASHLLSRQQDLPLAFGERLRLRLHLTVCDACSHFQGSLRFLRQAARRAPPSKP
ncbi:MAG: zf-HC2 domain-containing protein [Paludibacterium sp.]|uniref:zf-HC2 domain-containing protein n=1 Tax=Paludibacterium sp. TaxID=1917523 RepID=UPI0025CD06BF|nr:zf-HC2 domain-containing protein [Paludibacterium sp.]MBV8048041.1 zf-HC2 domain-containing protein [Paludibacterium sp.]MBV8647565.1 zf-HC2 domain-containing protein [Paludibacterium sp.]